MSDVNYSIADIAIADKAVVNNSTAAQVDYKGLRVYTGDTVIDGNPIGVTTPNVTLFGTIKYTLQFKIVMKSETKILDYIYAGSQKLDDLDVTTFSTVNHIDGLEEKLCFVEFVCEKDMFDTKITIGRKIVGTDAPNTEIMLVRDVQLQVGKMTRYTETTNEVIIRFDRLETYIEQLASKINLMTKKSEYHSLTGKMRNLEASINVQAGLIENKVSEDDFSSLIRQTPKDIQYCFNSINPRYQYTDDGFYMYGDNGLTKASFKRGSFYTYNWTNGVLLGGLTPFVFENASSYFNAGQGIISAGESYFFTIGRDSTWMTDDDNYAGNLSSYLTINFRDRSNIDGTIETPYKLGIHAFAPTFIYDNLNLQGYEIQNCGKAKLNNLNTTVVNSYDGNKALHIDGESYGTMWNYRNWDWQGYNLYNAVWIDASDRTMKENISYEKDTEKYYDFIKNDYVMAKYNYIDDDRTKISAIAQDILVNSDGSDNEVGQLMVDCKQFMADQHPIGIDQNQLLNVTIGALQEAMKRIDALEEELKMLKKTNMGG